MAEKFDIEQYKLDNPGYSEEFYAQVKSNKEGGNPYSIFSSLFKKKKKKMYLNTILNFQKLK